MAFTPNDLSQPDLISHTDKTVYYPMNNKQHVTDDENIKNVMYLYLITSQAREPKGVKPLELLKLSSSIII
jgi:hypothetical protein